MNKFISALFTIFIFLGILPVSVFATSITTSPSTDTHVVKSSPNSNYANATSISSFYDFPRQDAGIILLQFPVDGIPQNATLKKATLELYLTSVSGPNQIGLRISQIANNWDGQVTWNTKPSFLDEAGSQINTQIDKNLGFKSFDITQIVQKWLNGSTNRGIAISPLVFDQVNYQNFASTNNLTANHRPKITLEYTTPLNIPIIPNIINIPIINVNLLTISDITIENIQTTTATVRWKTDENATSWVFYGDASDGSDRFDKQTGQNDSVTNHSINLANLQPGIRYSVKVMSKNADNQQAFGKITYLTTLSDPSQTVTPTPEPSSNPISKLGSTLENKVADITINSALSGDNVANETSGSGTEVQEANLTPKGPIGWISDSVGINRLAGILFIILSLMSFIGAVLLYILTKKVHHHIRKRFNKKNG